MNEQSQYISYQIDVLRQKLPHAVDPEIKKYPKISDLRFTLADSARKKTFFALEDIIDDIFISIFDEKEQQGIFCDNLDVEYDCLNLLGAIKQYAVPN